MKIQNKNIKIFNWVSLGLIYIIPMLISILFLKVPTDNRIDTGIYRDNPAQYVLTSEMVQNEIIEYQYTYYIMIILLAFVLIRFIGMLLYKKIDIFSSLILFFGALYLLSFNYDIFSSMEYNAKTFSQILITQDGNFFYSLSTLSMIGLLIIYPLIQIIKYTKQKLKNK